jgi:hypothetical protein
MGYDVHITRRKNWSESTGPAISEQEWLAYVGDDADLANLFWSSGNVDAKNPDLRLIAKMASVASALGATVQGDDGELYDASGEATPLPQPGLWSRIRGWVANWISPAATPIDEASLPFKVGDRVRDPWGNIGRVVEIDVRAEHGLGRITVTFESGRTSSSAAVAHGLERADA